jgi:hypothetical protein
MNRDLGCAVEKLTSEKLQQSMHEYRRKLQLLKVRDSLADKPRIEESLVQVAYGMA